MREDVVNSVLEFVDKVLAYFNEWPDDGNGEPELWFRGVSDATYGLLPGAYRRGHCDELSLFIGFQNTAPSYLTREPIDEWDWYYVMQHYGLPTRLLDWTESPLAALYFALESAKSDVAACVWVLDPGALNRLTHNWSKGYIIAPGAADTSHWLPGCCGRGRDPISFDAVDALRNEDGASVKRDNQKPLAIFARRSTPRIVAQRGVFTVHGTEEVPIEKLFDSSSSNLSLRIGRIVIDAGGTSEMLRALRALGVTRTTLFPEAESVAEDLKRLYKVDS